MTDENKNNENQPGSGKSPQKRPDDFPLQEYRLVPVEEWENRQEEETEIDLVELAQHIWSRRWFIAKVTGVFMVIGLLVALLSPKEYQTSATLMPEVASSQSQAGNLLQKYGGLLGISGSSLNSDIQGTIPPTLYPKIVQSLPFQLELLNQEVTFSRFDTTAIVYDFFNDIYTPSIFTYFQSLPGKIIDSIRGEIPEQPLPQGFQADTVISVTKDQMKIIKNMQDRVSVGLDEESGILTLTAKMPDPQAAAVVGQKSIRLLKDYVKNYRTRKALQDLQFARTQLQQAKHQFEEAQNRLASFRDQNKNLVTAKAQTQEQRLQSEYDLAFNVYNSLAQQVEQAKLKVQEQTPVVSVLQPVQVPVDDMMSGFLVLFIISVLGLVLSIIILFGNYFLELKKSNLKYYKEKNHEA